MLVLDRKEHEGFWIENRIFIKVLSVGKRRVKLGIEAPSDIAVVREELKNGKGRPRSGLDEPVPGDQEGETFRSARW